MLAREFGISTPEHVRTLMGNGADAMGRGNRVIHLYMTKGKKESEVLKELRELARSILKPKSPPKRWIFKGLKPK